MILATIGIFLPILPTTPFLLLAAFFYPRSSQRFYDWLLTNRWFGQYIRNYREGRGITLRHKVFTILLLWGTISYSALVVASHLWLKLLLIGMAVGMTTHLLKVKTYRPEKPQPQPVQDYPVLDETK